MNHSGVISGWHTHSLDQSGFNQWVMDDASEALAQLKAANGPVSLRAHTDTLQLLAHKDIHILSVNSEITVGAQSKIELIGADSGITLDDGNISFTTPGTWTAKGAMKEMVGGSRASVNMPELPAGLTPEDGPFVGAYVLNKTDDRPFQGYRYRIVEGGKILIEGKSTQSGKTELMSTKRSQFVEVQKTIMRDDQKITENWAAYLDGKLKNAIAPTINPIPEDYVGQFEEQH